MNSGPMSCSESMAKTKVKSEAPIPDFQLAIVLSYKETKSKQGYWEFQSKVHLGGQWHLC